MSKVSITTTNIEEEKPLLNAKDEEQEQTSKLLYQEEFSMESDEKGKDIDDIIFNLNKASESQDSRTASDN